MKNRSSKKPRKILITFEEYQAILLGLSEIEGSIGQGDLSGKEIGKYEESEKALRELIRKIIGA